MKLGFKISIRFQSGGTHWFTWKPYIKWSLVSKYMGWLWFKINFETWRSE